MSQITNKGGTGPTPPTTIETLTGNTGGAVGPTGNNINIVAATGSGTFAGNPGTSTITYTQSGADANSFPTDSGTAIPSAGALTVHGTHNINTSGAGSTVSVNGNNTITVGDLASVAGSDAITIATGNLSFTPALGNDVNLINMGGAPVLRIPSITNTFLGSAAGNGTLSSFGNTGLGAQTLSLITSGQNNTAVGNDALHILNTGNYNTSVGDESSTQVTSGQYNTAVGYTTLGGITTGSANIAIGVTGGSGSGANWGTGSESNNIAIASRGDNNTSGQINIGTNGTHTKVFIAGIDGVNVGSVAKVVTEASDQLGTATITAGTGIAVTPTANTITISSSADTPLSFPTDAGTATPSANALNILGAHNINTTGVGSTVTVQNNNTATFGDLSVVTAGNPSMTLTSGDLTISGTGVGAGGNINLPQYVDNDATQGLIRTTSNQNILIASGGGATFAGFAAGNTTYTNAENTGVGTAALNNLSTGRFNVAIGNHTATALTTGVNNTLVGDEVAPLLTSGSGNTIVGYAIGGAATFNGSDNVVVNSGQLGQILYTGTESNNILIGNVGVAAESNVMHIGTNGTGAGQQNTTFIHGGNVLKPNSCAFLASQLGDQTNVTGDGTIYTVTFTNVINDYNSNFDGTSTFTAPVTGVYMLGFSLGLSSSSNFSGQNNSVFSIITTATEYRFQQYNLTVYATTQANAVQINGSTLANMTAGDTATILCRVIGGAKDVTVAGSTTYGYRTPVFYGYLIG